MSPGGKSFITWDYLLVFFCGHGLTTGPGNFKPIGIPGILNLLIREDKIPQVPFLPESLSNQNYLMLVMFIGELRETLTGRCPSKKWYKTPKFGMGA